MCSVKVCVNADLFIIKISDSLAYVTAYGNFDTVKYTGRLLYYVWTDLYGSGRVVKSYGRTV